MYMQCIHTIIPRGYNDYLYFVIYLSKHLSKLTVRGLNEGLTLPGRSYLALHCVQSIGTARQDSAQSRLAVVQVGRMLLQKAVIVRGGGGDGGGVGGGGSGSGVDVRPDPAA